MAYTRPAIDLPPRPAPTRTTAEPVYWRRRSVVLVALAALAFVAISPPRCASRS